MSASDVQLIRDYYVLTGVCSLYEKMTGVRQPDLYESLARLRDAALEREAVQPTNGTEV